MKRLPNIISCMFKQPAIEFTTMPLARPVRLPGWALMLLVLVYLLPGNLGHGPWRGDDLINIAASADMLRSGSWLMPHLAGTPVFDASPLHYWLGALFGGLLGWLLPLHDAIRLASVTALFGGLWALQQAARELLPQDDKGHAALLLSLGTLGLVVHAHESQAQITLLACLCGMLWACARMARQARSSGLMAGAFCAACFLAGGLAGLWLSMPMWLATLWSVRRRPSGDSRAPLCSRDYLPGALLALLLITAWPLLLYLRDPLLLDVWWHQQWLNLNPQLNGKRLSTLFGLLSWFAWPLWPVAAWALWHRRAQLGQLGFVLPLTALLCALSLILSSAASRPASILPVLPGLVLLAAGELSRLRRGASNWLNWFGIITFSLLGIFIWFAWSALHLGWPVAMGRNVTRLAPGFLAQISVWSICVATALSAMWLLAIWRVPRFALRGALFWALGVTLTWGLLTTLWLDWFDYDRNYAPIMARISRDAASQQSSCVQGLGTGATQLAAFDYFTKLSVFSYSSKDERCNLVLSYASARNKLRAPDGDWQLLWRVEKGRGRIQEQFALYRRER